MNAFARLWHKGMTNRANAIREMIKHNFIVDPEPVVLADIYTKEKQIQSLINSVITVAEEFVGKVGTGKTIRPETYYDMQKLKAEAELLKKALCLESKQSA